MIHKSIFFCCILSIIPLGVLFGQNNDLSKDHTNLDSLYELGSSMYSKRNFSEGLIILKKVAPKLLESKDSRYLSCINKITGGHLETQNYDSALKYGQQAINFREFDKLGDQAGAFYTYSFIKLLLLDKDSAYLCSTKAIKILSELGDSLNLANAYRVRATVSRNLGSISDAIPDLKNALTIIKPKLGEQERATALIYHDLASTFRLDGNYDSASFYIEKALTTNWQDNFGASIFSTAANIKYDLREYNFSLEYLKRAFSLRKKLGSLKTIPMANLLAAMGNTFTDLGQPVNAIKKFKEALEIRLEIYKEVENLAISGTYKNMALAYNEAKMYDSATYYLKKTEQIEKAHNQRDEELVYTKKYLAEIYAGAGQINEAKKYFKEAINLFVKTYDSDHPVLIDTYNAISDFYYENQEADSALHFVQLALASNTRDYDADDIYSIPDISQAFNLNIFIKSLVIKYKILSRRYLKSNDQKLRSILSEVYTNAKSALDLCTSTVTNNSDNIVLSDLSTALNAIYIKLQTDEGYVFNSIENTKNLSLRLNFQDRKAKQNANIPQNLLKKEEFLRSQIRKFSSSEDNTDSLFSVNRYLDTLISYFEENYELYYSAKYKTEVIDLNQLQENLSKNQLLIEYFQSDTTLYLMAISNDDVHMHTIAYDSSLADQVERFNQIFRSKERNFHSQQFLDEYTTLSSTLYQKIIAPVFDNFDKQLFDKLTIIPDGELSYLPFETLLQSRGTGPYVEMDYLINDYAIQYAYSATLLYEDLYSKKTKASKNLLAFAPSYQNESIDSLMRISLGKFRDDFNPLKWNIDEVDNIASQFGETPFTSENATEKLFKENATDYKILHLAMHGLVDDEDPMNSKLAFSKQENSLEDGFLHAFEIFNMDLNADLAVLSACNSNFGTYQKGEGIASLGRAFAYAGVPALVTTHWEVDDQVSSEIMILFYTHLKNGMEKSKALRQAKLDYLKEVSPVKSNPFFWGSFVLIGKDTPIDLEENNHYYWIILILVLLSLFVVIRYYRR